MTTFKRTEAIEKLQDRIQSTYGFHMTEDDCGEILDSLFDSHPVDTDMEAATLDDNCLLAAIEDSGPFFINLTMDEIVIKSSHIGNMTLPPSGILAHVKEKSHDYNEDGVRDLEYGEVEGLPNPIAGIYYVVSNTAIRKVEGRQDVVAAVKQGVGVIRNEKGRIIACPGFYRNKSGEDQHLSRLVLGQLCE